MHYKKKKTAKIHSGTFFIPESLLKKLDFIVHFENQSRSVIVERAILFNLGGKNNEWEKSKRIYKKKKKIFNAQRCFKKHCKECKNSKNKQERFFDSLFGESF